MKNILIAAALFALSANSAVAQGTTRYCGSVMLAMMYLKDFSDEKVTAIMQPFRDEARRNGDNANARRCLKELKELGVWPEVPLAPKSVHLLYLLGTSLQ